MQAGITRDDLFKWQVQFHGLTMKKVFSEEFPYFHHSPLLGGKLESSADWLNGRKVFGGQNCTSFYVRENLV